MRDRSTEDQFNEALASLTELIRDDRSILAAVLCGSLSHDTVWEKSDVDLVLVTIDDHKVKPATVSLNANGVNVHAMLVPRTEFRRIVEGSLRNSFVHAFLTKGRLLFSHDETIADLCRSLSERGGRDTQIQMMRAATNALPPIYKAHKWFVTRDDLEYTALWILYSAESLARIEVVGAGLVADREVIPQAMKLNPSFFNTVYSELLNVRKTRTGVKAALDAIDDYMSSRAASLFAPLIEHLREVGETRSCTEIEDHFRKSYDMEGVTTACEYLADQGIIAKAAVAGRLTRRSNVDVQELAFVLLEDKAG